MASDITPGNIDGTYPIARQNNDSQGFRTNFTNIITNFTEAKAEIEDLQAKAVLKAPLDGESVTNNILTLESLTTSASTTVRAGLNIPEGVAPTTPNDGDMWVTTTDIIARVNGVSESLLPADLGEFTVAGLPTASANANRYALATNAAGGRTTVRSDGTNWKIIAVEGATVT